MKLYEKKKVKVPHALSVKLCMRSHGCEIGNSSKKPAKKGRSVKGK